MESGGVMRNKCPVINDRKSFSQTVTICNENNHHSLILNYWKIPIIALPTKTPAFLKVDRGFNERL
jgi:hypothetical protein